VTLRELTAFSTELLSAYSRNDAPRATILEVQRRRLRDLIAVAGQTRRYRGLTSFDDAPPTDKRAVLDDFDGGLVKGAPGEAVVRAFLERGAPASLLNDRFIVATTSGTTGEVGIFVTDDASFARLRATVFARIFRGQLKPEGFALLAKRRYRLTFVVATGGHTMTSVLALRMPKAGRIAADVSVVSIDQPLHGLVQALNTHPPLLLHSYATVLELLAHEQLQGRLRLAPEIVTAGSEPLTQQARQILQAAFPSATILETWAATEHVALAVSCKLGHLHLNEDVAIIEAVDDDNRPVPAGSWSERVLITNLLNLTQPLLRYRLDDRVRIDPVPCLCGSPFARIEVEGRTDDTIYLDDGHGFQAHTPIPFEVVLLGVPGLWQFALVHEQQNELRLSMVIDPGADAATVAAAVVVRMERHLREHGLTEHVSFVVEQVPSLSRHPRSGKLRQITSLVRKPEAFVPAATRRVSSEATPPTPSSSSRRRR
jgi:phenylacetate-CoA ligase